MGRITVKCRVNVSLSRVWKLWTASEHLAQWNIPSKEWRTIPRQNNLQPGGKFNFRMEPMDGRGGFDFEGTYDEVVPSTRIAYTLSDGRKAIISFTEKERVTEIVETFDADSREPVALQRDFCKAVLGHFKTYAEDGTPPKLESAP